MQKVNLAEKLAQFSDHWKPKIVGELNGQQVKLVKFQGPFVWHHHHQEDELFLLKIEAAIQNAQMFLAVQQEFGTFDEYIWGFVGSEPKQNAWKSIKAVPAKTPESDAMSKDLKRRAFKFVGSTICYAFMQAVGMVNDHLVECFRHTQLSR